jgi:hypothetical protein
MYVYVCIYLCMHACMHACMRIYACIHTHTHTHMIHTHNTHTHTRSGPEVFSRSTDRTGGIKHPALTGAYPYPMPPPATAPAPVPSSRIQSEAMMFTISQLQHDLQSVKNLVLRFFLLMCSSTDTCRLHLAAQ